MDSDPFVSQGSSNSVYNSGRTQVTMDVDTLPLAPASTTAPDPMSQATPPPPSNAQSQAESVVPIEDDGDENASKSLDGILISYSGKDVIKDYWERKVVYQNSMSNARDFLDDFRDKHQLQFDSINNVLTFLESCNLSRNDFAKILMSNLVSLTKQRIRSMTQDQLKDLLSHCFTYLTVKELSPVVIATLEHVKYVPPKLWGSIVENGLDESPYIDLPLALKHRIWQQAPNSFEHEIKQVVNRIELANKATATAVGTDAANAMDFASASATTTTPNTDPLTKFRTFETPLLPEQRKAVNKTLSDFLQLVQGLPNELLANAAERLYEITISETNQMKRVAIADLFHDYLILAPNRAQHHMSSSFSDIQKHAKALCYNTSNMKPTLQAVGAVTATSSLGAQPIAMNSATGATVNAKDIATIVANINDPGSESKPYFTFIVSSSISRDYLADEVIKKLYDCRGDVSRGQDEELLQKAKRHLMSHPLLIQLTQLLLYNTKGMDVLIEPNTTFQEEVDRVFNLFYPLLIDEMFTDWTAKHHDYSKKLSMASNPKLLPLVIQNVFERRIIASYCLFLWKNQDIPALFRQRMLLDAIVATSDPVTEPREYIIATTVFKSLNKIA